MLKLTHRWNSKGYKRKKENIHEIRIEICSISPTNKISSDNIQKGWKSWNLSSHSLDFFKLKMVGNKTTKK